MYVNFLSRIFVSEIIATLGLIIIIFGSMKSGKITVAASVGLYITAGYWFTSSTSFANPAVAIARTFTDSFTGINYLNTPTYILAEFLNELVKKLNGQCITETNY